MMEKKGQGKSVDIRTQVRDHYGSIAAEFEATGEAGCCGPAESGCGCSSPDAVDTLNTKLADIYDNPDVESRIWPRYRYRHDRRDDRESTPQ